MKIHIDGRDMLGWSIDQDRANIIKLLDKMGLTHGGWLGADIIHNIWWNRLLSYNCLKLLLKKNILVTASNFIDLDDKQYFLQDSFNRVTKIAKAWVAPSTKQKKIFDSHGIRCYYMPFLLDQELFKPRKIDKTELLEKLNLPQNLQSKIIIGSFQRDSLGHDLSMPKWQKGPELLIEILKGLSPEKYVLLLAGPRRHYLIEKCKRLGIPYHYIGKETSKDDIQTNHIAIDQMPLLYCLTDIYLISSRSEGGPKSVLESCATQTFVMSTDVGLAGDFIKEGYVFKNTESYKEKLYKIVEDFDSAQSNIKSTIEYNHSRFREIMAPEALAQQLLSMYTDILTN